MFCRSLFVLFLLVTVLSVLRLRLLITPLVFSSFLMVFGFTRPRLEPTRVEHANHYTTGVFTFVWYLYFGPVLREYYF